MCETVVDEWRIRRKIFTGHRALCTMTVLCNNQNRHPVQLWNVRGVRGRMHSDCNVETHHRRPRDAKLRWFRKKISLENVPVVATHHHVESTLYVSIIDFLYAYRPSLLPSIQTCKNRSSLINRSVFLKNYCAMRRDVWDRNSFVRIFSLFVYPGNIRFCSIRRDASILTITDICVNQ